MQEFELRQAAPRHARRPDGRDLRQTDVAERRQARQQGDGRDDEGKRCWSAAVTANVCSKIRVEIFLMAAWSAMRTICAPNWLCMATINRETASGATLNPERHPRRVGPAPRQRIDVDPQLSLRIAVIGKDADDCWYARSRPPWELRVSGPEGENPGGARAVR